MNTTKAELREALGKLIQRWGWLDDVDVQPAIDDVIVLFSAHSTALKQLIEEELDKIINIAEDMGHEYEVGMVLDEYSKLVEGESR